MIVISVDKYLPYWNNLDESLKKQLSASVKEIHIEKGTVISDGQTKCTGLIIVIKGQLRAYLMSEEGREITLYRLKDGDMCLFSASCIMNGIHFDMTVEAAANTDAFLIPVDVYKKISDNSAAAANYTNSVMASRFSDVMWLVDQLINKKLDSRLAALLIEESSFAGGDILTVTHEELGNHLGSVREVITRMLRYFQSEGVVKLTRGKIEITDFEKLKQIASSSIK